ncbi:MAG: squalene/phytoene synthase family protein [Chthoniobacterales bacterium]
MNENEILRRTARSFYLTIRLLPRSLRDDIALAYLLARATDTIADASSAPEEQRLGLLRAARASLGRPSIASYDPGVWARWQRDAAERQLLVALPGLWARLGERGDGLVAGVLDRILEGQIFDLERFGSDAAPLCDEELERYTYLVAGSVGEFWTDLCAARLGDFARDPADLMRQRARHYGQALQLVNILRDRHMDAALGRIYVTEADAGRWTEQATAWLGEGADYCAALRSGRLRYATLLPALLGWRTLSLVAVQPPGLLTPSKVSRGELRQWMWRALPVWWSSERVRRLAAVCSE